MNYIRHTTTGAYCKRITKGGKIIWTPEKESAKQFHFNNALKVVLGEPCLKIEKSQPSKLGLRWLSWKG
jgi:hypothetical protein